jgi:hypothetical protein
MHDGGIPVAKAGRCDRVVSMQQTPRIINLEETIGKTVGRRRPPVDALAAGFAMQETLNEFLKSSGHRLAPRGVFRFRSHEEANAWTMKMMRPAKGN